MCTVIAHQPAGTINMSIVPPAATPTKDDPDISPALLQHLPGKSLEQIKQLLNRPGIHKTDKLA